MKRTNKPAKLLRISPIMMIIAILAMLLGSMPTGTLAAQPDPTAVATEKVLRYLVAHRADVALANYTVAPGGVPDPTDPILLHNPDEPMPLASTIKIVLLAGYTREVTAGRMSPDTLIRVGDWERYYLPGSDGGAHAASLAALGLPADQDGFALNPDTTVTLDTIAGMMIRFSDNAAADLILELVGDQVVSATITEAGLMGQEQPLPLVGIFLSWFNHEQPALTDERLAYLLALSPAEYAAEVRRLRDAYLSPDWGAAEREWRRGGGPVPNPQNEARAANSLFPKGTARDYARIMAGVIDGSFLAPPVAALMRRHLEWPMQIPGNAEVFIALGNKGGLLAGVLTDATFAIPRGGDFAGRPRVVVLFMRNMPLPAFAAFSQTFAHQLFNLRLATDRAFVEHVYDRLIQPNR